MGAFIAGMFHLVTHAFFKALLFLSSGSVIQGVERGEHHVEHDPKLKKAVKGHAHHPFDPQDMRNMGGLRTRMKTTFWVYVIGALALAGIFPLAGFWSKDEILAEASHLHPQAYWLLTIAAFFTAFYMGRQIWLVFFGTPRSEAAAHAQESPRLMTIPLIILAALSLLGGFMNLPGVHTFGHWLEHTIKIEEAVQAIQSGEAAVEGAAEAAAASGFNLGVALLSTALALIAIGLSYWLYMRRYPALQQVPAAKRPDDPLRALGPIFTGMEHKWWIDELYWAVILNPYIAASRFLAEVVDWRFWHDWFHDVVLAGGYNLLCHVLSVRVDLGGIDRFANLLAEWTQGSASWPNRPGAQLCLIRFPGCCSNFGIFDPSLRSSYGLFHPSDDRGHLLTPGGGVGDPVHEPGTEKPHPLDGADHLPGNFRHLDRCAGTVPGLRP
jgi:NADH-quinone oxidoreductase subunit L